MSDTPENEFEVITGPILDERQVAIATAFEDRLKLRIGQLVQGGAADVQKYAADLSLDLALAATSDNKRAMRHLRAQVKNLGEKHRLAASKAIWGQIADFSYDLAFMVTKTLVVAL